MALSITTLKNNLKSDLLTLYASAKASEMSEETFADSFAEILATRIINHFKNDGDIHVDPDTGDGYGPGAID